MSIRLARLAFAGFFLGGGGGPFACVGRTIVFFLGFVVAMLCVFTAPSPQRALPEPTARQVS